MKKVFLVLEDKTVFEGYRFGADMETIGEIVFNTGVVGYTETLTDPGYYGQIVVNTFPSIGNYGINEEDFEGKCVLNGFVVREYCDAPSNFRSQYGIDEFLKNNNVPGIYGVDTRLLTKHLRSNGVMNAKICDAIPDDLAEISEYSIVKAVESVTRKSAEVLSDGDFKVALIDMGAKNSLITELKNCECSVIAVPANTAAEDILAYEPNGIVVSNGPGDPAENVYCITQVKKLMGKVPMLGVGLGHQIMALACGAKTEKLKYGHRGANQPVKDAKGTRTYITSQNHGYSVVSSSVTEGSIRFVNANDGECEGIDYDHLNAFSVQFHPNNGTGFLFDRFMSMMKESE